jgi:hypothetical protein
MASQISSADWAKVAAYLLVRLWNLHRGRGFVFVAARRAGGGSWEQRSFSLRSLTTGSLLRWFRVHPRCKYDLYFCPNPFRRKRRIRSLALPTPLAWSDIDEGDCSLCRLVANLLILTSPGRTQGIWLFDRVLSVDEAEAASRTLTIEAHGDRNGWSVTKYLRVPGTNNHKREYNFPTVRLLNADWTPQVVDPQLAQLASVPNGRILVTSGMDRCLRHLPDFSKTFRRYRFALHPRVRALVRDRTVWQRDRSKCVYEIVCDLHRVGASFAEIAAILQDNAYFTSKYGRSATALEREVNRILEKLGERNP